MDTSKEYIAMCYCEEIQLSRTTLDIGDIVENENGLDIVIKGRYELDIKTDIWLPRQDQLQEMCASDNDLDFSFDDMILQPTIFVANHEADIIIPLYATITMEQIWLMIYMKEKHNKTWNGNNWI